MDSELYEKLQQVQIKRAIDAIEKIATSLEKIENTLHKGLNNDFSDNAYLWEIYQSLHPNREEEWPNSVTEISDSLKRIAQNRE